MPSLAERIMRAKGTTLKFATMFVVSQLLSGGSLNDEKWMRSSLLTIVGFAVFDMLVTDLVDTSSLQGPTLNAVNTCLKVGTMMIVSRLLAGGDLTDPQWLKQSGATLAGFTAWHLVGSQLVDLSRFTGKTRTMVEDVAVVSTMNVVARTLLGGDIKDEKWMKQVAFDIGGFLVYDKVVDGMF